MKVALVVPSFEVGGVETFLLRLARYLRARGHAVGVLATERPGAWWSRLSDEQVQAECLSPDRAFSRASCARRLGARLSSYDVALLNHSRLGQAAIPWVDGRVAVLPVFHNDHAPIYDLASTNVDGWNAGIAVGPRVLAQAERRVPRAKLVYIPHGVDLPSAEQLTKRAGRTVPTRLLYLGRLSHSQKGVLHLPAILADVTRRGIDATLTVAGDGPDAEALAKGFAEAGMADRARLVGAVPSHTAYELLLAHHVLVAPSFHEGFPVGILEAQACGCVPVVSRLEGITDAAVASGETGCLVTVGAVQEFGEAVAGLCIEEARWREMSQAGIERARLAFGLEVMGLAYERLFIEVLGGKYPVRAEARAALRFRNRALTWRDHVPNRARETVARMRGKLRASSRASLA